MGIKRKLSESGRIEHLDSLRGIAAVCVVMCHCLYSFKGPDQLGINNLLGRDAVLFFFLLSGFVLGRSIERNPITSFRKLLSYTIKRILRLYPAIVVTLIFAVAIAYHPIPYGACTLLTTAKQGLWAYSPPPIYSWIQQIVLVNIDLWHVMWTLQVEMVCSLLLPFVVQFHPRSTNWNIVFIMILALHLTPDFFSGLSIYLPLSLGLAKFFVVFYLGYLMNKIDKLEEFMTPDRSKWVLFLGLMALIPASTQGIRSFDLLVTLILCFLFSALIPCNLPYVKKFLLSSPMLFLGRISYSCYLLHPVGIYIGIWYLLRWIPGVLKHPLSIPPLLLFIIAMAITVPLSALMESLIERPFNILGHKLAKKVSYII